MSLPVGASVPPAAGPAINPSRGLVEVVRHWSHQQPDRVALRFGGEETTWRRLWNRIERATARLASEWQVKTGDRVAYLGMNRPEELILLFALARLGAVLLPLNYRLAASDWTAILDDAGARHLLHDHAFEGAAQDLARVTTADVFALEALIAKPSVTIPEPSPVPLSAPVLLVYTSGTTGRPKGVVHSQEGLWRNAQASIAAHEFRVEDHVLTVLPLFHVGGLCIQTLPALVAGATVTLHERFEAGAWLAELEASRPSLSLMVPATLSAVIEHPRFRLTSLDGLRGLMAGSATIAARLLAAFHERGVPVGQIYGSTETGPVSVVLKLRDAVAKAGCAGWPAQGVRIRLVSTSGLEVAPGMAGEIWVQGDNLALGYWKHHDHPAFRDGWFRTGDLARADTEGCIRIVGRVSDLIISGGEHIYPAELEDILLENPGVLEAAVVGLADERWGESPVAAVVVRPGWSVERAAILAGFEGRVARFKIPRRIHYLDALPRNGLGKVQKLELIAVLTPKDTDTAEPG